MHIGPLHFTWQTSRKKHLITVEIREELRSVEVRNSIARLARGEVKNYLAELAEGAEMAFPSPAGFLRDIRYAVQSESQCGARPYPIGSEGDDGTSCVLPFGHEGNHCDLVDSFDGGAGFEQTEVVTLPNGHTNTCTCLDKTENTVRGENLCRVSTTPSIPAAVAVITSGRGSTLRTTITGHSAKVFVSHPTASRSVSHRKG